MARHFLSARKRYAPQYHSAAMSWAAFGVDPPLVSAQVVCGCLWRKFWYFRPDPSGCFWEQHGKHGKQKESCEHALPHQWNHMIKQLAGSSQILLVTPAIPTTQSISSQTPQNFLRMCRGHMPNFQDLPGTETTCFTYFTREYPPIPHLWIFGNML